MAQGRLPEEDKVSKTYIVEHLDPELEHWSALEYRTIAQECSDSGARFLLSSVPSTLSAHSELSGVKVEQAGVEELFSDRKSRICLLDPSASRELSPEDGVAFDIFLFGGILGGTDQGNLNSSIC